MKIKSIKAFAITDRIAGGIYDASRDKGTARRPPWTKHAEVANPMSRYPRYKQLRSSWNKYSPEVGCLVTADDGSWGFGTTGYGQPVASLINDHLGSLLVDENPFATEKLFDMMMRITSPYSPSGLASYAISAIDLALWDLKGRVLKMPVYELAGGAARDSSSATRPATTPTGTWSSASRLPSSPAPTVPPMALRPSTGMRNSSAKTRDLIGPNVELMLDCWMAFDVEFAVRLAERLRPYKLKWIEDCLIPEN